MQRIKKWLLQKHHIMKTLKHLPLTLTILMLICLSGSKVMSQKLTPKQLAELEETIFPVKGKVLLQLKGESDKKDSLLVAAEARFASYERYITSLTGEIDVQKKSVAILEQNSSSYQAIYKDTFDYNKTLVKENKQLKFKVKLFKGISIGLPAAFLGYIIYTQVK